MIKRILMTLAALLATMPIWAADVVGSDDPKADENAIVLSGNARFSVLTDRLVRMEWSADGVFEDRATLAIINRNLPVPKYTVTRNAGKLTIKTSALTLVYEGDGKFCADNLSVSFKLNGKTVKWYPGADDSGNLLGTTRTLDGCKGPSQLSHTEKSLEQGICSRDGWAIVDESGRHLLVPVDSDWKNWVAERPEGDRLDWYIFAYGHKYTEALSDFTKVAGKIPLPPKYTLGYWWSRYWAYTDEEFLQIGREMREREIPMDVYIVDMDWHLTWPAMYERLGKDEFGQRRGWTGYSWNHDLIPDPEGFLNDLHKLGYKTALNLHPASGIRVYEDCYDVFVKDYLSRTNDYDGPKDYVYGAEGYKYAGNEKACGREGYKAPVPFRMDQQEWADAYFNSVIHPFEKQGVDFWWLDWQQWRQSKYVKGLSNTFWLNYTFFNDKQRQGTSKGLSADRPFIYHRWGGLGSHRYQLGFSGDTYDEWSVLGFLPYFTATASNVGYGYWGHDIGGHMQVKKHPTDPEIFTRWIQYGVFTPIFKTHSTAQAHLDRRIWAYPTHYEYMREAILLRYALSPYIYNAAREAYDTGVSMTRPMYYVYPEDDRAYSCREQFFFGNDILATVLCSPAGADGLTERTMWFPAGNDWYDMAHHKMMKGGTQQTLRYAIDENPWYVRAGAVIPMAEEGIKNLQGISNVLRLLVVPGNGKSSFVHYEDDGMSQAYVKDFATTRITKTATSSSVKLTIDARCGAYAGMPETRCYTIVLEGVQKAPKLVKLNGKAVDVTVKEGKNSVGIVLPEISAGQQAVIEIVK